MSDVIKSSVVDDKVNNNVGELSTMINPPITDLDALFEINKLHHKGLDNGENDNSENDSGAVPSSVIENEKAPSKRTGL